MSLDPEMVRQRLGELGSADSQLRDDLAAAFRELRDELHSLSETVREVNSSLVTEVSSAEERFRSYTKDVNDKMVRRIDDHEDRLRSLERRQWMILGVLALAVFMAPLLERNWPW